MQKIYLLASCVMCSLLAHSQITLNNSNMPVGGDTLRYTNIQLNSLGNYTQTGTNYAWTFTSVVSTTEGVRDFKSSLQTPYAFFFLGVNEYGEKIADTISAGPLTITKYYNFYKKQNTPSAFIADGVGMTFSSIPVPSYYSDKDELYFFPMTYPKYDSSTFKFSTPTTSLLPIRYSKSGYRVTKVDGWGTIKTPFGSDNCLRIVTTQYSHDTIKTTFGQITIPFGFPNYQRSYQWISLTSKIPYFEVTGNLVGANFTPTLARFKGRDLLKPPPPPPPPPPIDETGISEVPGVSFIQASPNPVKESLQLIKLNYTKCIMEIYAISGKLVKQGEVQPLDGKLSLDVSGLDAGIYLMKLSQDDKCSLVKFVKE